MTPEEHIPKSIGIIMDGNRRWAKERGLPTLEGHRHGGKTLEAIAEAAREAGVRTLIFYAFSTENWKRSPEEVAYLLELMDVYLEKHAEPLLKHGARFRVIGDRSRFKEVTQKRILALEEKTKDAPNGTLAFAVSYGGRADIVQAVNTLLAGEKSQVTEEDISRALWTHDIDDPDMVIRTSGERRLSGFLTWDSVYSELFFTDTYWPDFSKEEFNAMLAEYATRERRRGK